MLSSSKFICAGSMVEEPCARGSVDSALAYHGCCPGFAACRQRFWLISQGCWLGSGGIWTWRHLVPTQSICHCWLSMRPTQGEDSGWALKGIARWGSIKQRTSRLSPVLTGSSIAHSWTRGGQFDQLRGAEVKRPSVELKPQASVVIRDTGKAALKKLTVE